MFIDLLLWDHGSGEAGLQAKPRRHETRAERLKPLAWSWASLRMPFEMALTEGEDTYT